MTNIDERLAEIRRHQDEITLPTPKPGEPTQQPSIAEQMASGLEQLADDLREGRPVKATTVTNEQLSRIAAKHPAPQVWYEHVEPGEPGKDGG